jgi:hypothetical protein
MYYITGHREKEKKTLVRYGGKLTFALEGLALTPEITLMRKTIEK